MLMLMLIKEKCVEFLFLFFLLFRSLIRNENTKRPGFYRLHVQGFSQIFHS